MIKQLGQLLSIILETELIRRLFTTYFFTICRFDKLKKDKSDFRGNLKSTGQSKYALDEEGEEKVRIVSDFCPFSVLLLLIKCYVFTANRGEKRKRKHEVCMRNIVLYNHFLVRDWIRLKMF